MKNHLAASLFLLLTHTCIGQATAKEKSSALSFELGKTGLIYNLNYDHKFGDKNFGFRVDAGSNLAKYLEASMVGGGGYYLIGKRNHFFELGADLNYLSVYEVSDDQISIVFIYPDYTIKTYYASLNLGFRKYGKRSLFRIGFSPGFFSKGFIPGGYISYGGRF